MLAANIYDLVASIITGIVTGGGIAAVVALLKVRPEAGQIVVTAAQGALIVQSGVIKELREELRRVQEEAEQKIAKLKESLEKSNDEIRRLTEIIANLKLNQERHDLEVKSLQGKR